MGIRQGGFPVGSYMDWCKRKRGPVGLPVSQENLCKLNKSHKDPNFDLTFLYDKGTSVVSRRIS